MMHKSTLAGYGVDSCRLFDVQPHERARRVHHWSAERPPRDNVIGPRDWTRLDNLQVL